MSSFGTFTTVYLLKRKRRAMLVLDKWISYHDNMTSQTAP